MHDNILTHPDSCVWLIEAVTEGAGKVCSTGSAVAVRLSHAKSPDSVGIYLITCAHVIRRNVNERTLGPCYSRFWAYRPDSTYSVAERLLLELVSSIVPYDCTDRDRFYHQATANDARHDWAVLKLVAGHADSDGMKPYVLRHWPKREVERKDQCFTIGYPGGGGRFRGNEPGRTNTVTPKLLRSVQCVEMVSLGVITASGGLTNRGESGGGVFRGDGDDAIFHGLHRLRCDDSRQLEAVSAWAISDRLQSLGYTLVGADKRRPVVVHSDALVSSVSDNQFVGRDDSVQEVIQQLRSHKAVVISGLGGLGKSELAKHVAIECDGLFDVMLCVDGASPISIESGMAAFVGRELESGEVGSDIEAPERVRALAVEKWLATNTRWLLVIDGSDTELSRDAVFTLIRKLRRRGSLVITSRLEGASWMSKDGDTAVIALGMLDECSSSRFILDTTASSRKPTVHDAALAKQFAQHLGGLPLALTVVAGWINSQNDRTLTECLRIYCNRKISNPVWASREGSKSRSILEAAWDTAWHEMDVDGRRMLGVLSWLAPTVISRQVIYQLEVLEHSVFGEGIAGEAMSMLTKCSLASKTKGGTGLILHPLVQEFARLRSRQESPVWTGRSLQLALEMLCAAFPANPTCVSQWPSCAELRPHVESVLAHLGEVAHTAQITKLRYLYGRFLCAIGESKVAESHLQFALSRFEQEFGVESLEVADALSSLARMYEDTSRLAEAGNCYLRSHRVTVLRTGAESPLSQERSLDNCRFAQHLRSNDAGEIASNVSLLQLIESAVSILEVVYGRREPRFAVALIVNANELIYLNRAVEAIPLLRDSVKVLGDVGPDAAENALRAKQLLSLALRMEGRVEDSLVLCREVLTVAERMYGSQHPQYAIAVADVAQSIEAQDPSEAARLYLISLDVLGFYADRNDRWQRTTKEIIEAYLSFRLEQEPELLYDESLGGTLLAELPGTLFSDRIHTTSSTARSRCIQRCFCRDCSIKQIASDDELQPYLSDAAVALQKRACVGLRVSTQYGIPADILRWYQVLLRRALEIFENYCGIDDSRTISCRAEYWKQNEWTQEVFYNEISQNLTCGSLGLRMATRRVELAWQSGRFDLLKDLRLRLVLRLRGGLVELFQPIVAAEYFCGMSIVDIANGDVQDAAASLWGSIRRFSSVWGEDEGASHLCILAVSLLRRVYKQSGEGDDELLYSSLVQQTGHDEFCQYVWGRTDTV